MDVVGFYSATQIEIRGSVRGLLDLARAARERKAPIELAPADPGGWDGCINRIHLLVDEDLHKLKVFRDGEEILIEGSAKHIESVAEILDMLAKSYAGNHVHLEPYDGNPFLDPASIPLILGRNHAG